MAAVAATAFESCGAGRQVQFIVHDQNLCRGNAQEIGQGTDRLPAAVHEGGWLLHAEIPALQAAARDVGMETRLVARTAAAGRGQLIDEPEPGIVPGLCVFRTGVSQSDDELHRGQDAPALGGRLFARLRLGRLFHQHPRRFDVRDRQVVAFTTMQFR